MQLQRHTQRRGLGLSLDQLNPTQQQNVSNYASALGMSAGQVAGYAALVQNDSVAVSNAVAALQKGNAVTALKDAAPVIGGAIALVNPVAGAVVGGVLEAVGVLLSALGVGQQPSESCNWKWPPTPGGVRGACFTNSSRPYGPSSNEWVSLQTFASSYAITTNPWIDLYWKPSYSNPSWLDDTLGLNDSAIPGAWNAPGYLLGPELALLGDQGPVAQWWRTSTYTYDVARGVYTDPQDPLLNPPRTWWATSRLSTANSRTFFGKANASTYWRWTTPGLQAFALVFDRVWASACEYPINGWQMPQASGPTGLLQFTANAWNNLYPAGKPVAIDGTFAADGFYKSFADAVVAGQVDQWVTQSSEMQQTAPVIVNDPTGYTQSALSPTAFVAGAAGAAALGTVGYALLTKQSIAAVLKGFLSNVPRVL